MANSKIDGPREVVGAPPPRYVVVDLEATCWDDREKTKDMETIEIGAVKLDQSLAIADEFRVYIRPVVEPVLSDLCKSITGITQEQVDAGIPFTEAFGQFTEWVGQPVTLCSWGRFDITQFDRDCTRHSIDLPDWLVDGHVNLRRLFEQRYSGRYPYISDAFESIGMEFKGSPHSGIDDARNAAGVIAMFGGAAA